MTDVFLIPVMAGFAVAWSAAYALMRAMMSKSRESELPAPEGISGEEWDETINLPDSNQKLIRFYGNLELSLFYLAMVLPAFSLIVGWLLFKVGSKWAAWQHITKLPDYLGSEDKRAAKVDLSYLRARNYWSSLILQKWLVGTIANVLCAALGSVVHYALGGEALLPLQLVKAISDSS